jgi:hypothetical protein
MSDVRGRVDGRVLVLKVEGTEEGWEQTDLWRSAAAIPGVQVSRDDSGRAAAAFGAATSGQTFFYDASGELRFAGGLTPSRGHQGDSLGRAVILATVNEGRIGQVVTDVFGCGLTAERGAR